MDTPTVIWIMLLGISLIAVATAIWSFTMSSRKTSLESDSSCFFLFDGTTLKSASASAQELLQRSPVGDDAYAQLLGNFDDQLFADQMDKLVSQGKTFSRMVRSHDDQLLEIEGQPVGGLVSVEIKVAGTDARKLIETQNELNRLRKECQMMRETLDNAPMHVVRIDGQGEFIWQNETFKEEFTADETASAQLRRAGSERICIENAHKEDHWFSLQKLDLGQATKTIYATPIDTLVNAEKSLANFVSTLTETFAHLTTGLAIFDSNGRLSLFNPALSDLTGVDPTRLIAQPTIRDFLELMRELRMVPEQKDFSAWRQTITRLERGSREGSYHEDWTLPSGRVFRVIGRPHPNGAVALIFEDISSTITLERRYRDEIELGQAALDRISDAVAIFDTSGSLVFANNAFDDMWQIDSMTSLEAPDIAQMTKRWSESCLPTPIWDRLRSFVTSDQSRTSWQAEVSTKSSQHLHGHFSPLPNGSTLAVFSKSHITSLADSMSEEETALLVAKSTRDALLAIVTGDLNSETSVTDGIDNGSLSLLKSLSDLPQPESFTGDHSLTSEMVMFAATRGIKLKFDLWDWHENEAPPAPIPTLLWTFLLAAIETNRTDDVQAELHLSAKGSTRETTFTARRAGLKDDPEGLSLRYLASLADRLSDNYTLNFAPDQLKLSFSLADNAQDIPLRRVGLS